MLHTFFSMILLLRSTPESKCLVSSGGLLSMLCVCNVLGVGLTGYRLELLCLVLRRCVIDSIASLIELFILSAADEKTSVVERGNVESACSAGGPESVWLTPPPAVSVVERETFLLSSSSALSSTI